MPEPAAATAAVIRVPAGSIPMTIHDTRLSASSADGAPNVASVASDLVQLLRISMHSPKTIARRGVGRGSACLQESAREHEIRLSQSETRLP